MISQYFTKLPTQINGEDIRTDFRVWLKFSEVMKSDRLEFEKLLQIKALIYKDRIPSLNAGDLKLLMDFFSCNSKKDNDNPSKEILLDYDIDGQMIYTAFMRVFNIDLSDCQYMHWWKFNALLCECMRGTNLGDVVQLRGIDVAEIKDDKQRQEMSDRKMKVFIGWNKRGDL